MKNKSFLLKWITIVCVCGAELAAPARGELQTQFLTSTAQIKTRYAAILQRAQTLSVKMGRPVRPLLFKQVVAPRLIGRSDWSFEKGLPWIEPAGVYGSKTWQQWVRVAIDLVKIESSRSDVMSLGTLEAWHAEALSGLIPSSSLGRLTRFPRHGRNLKKLDALSLDEIRNLAHISIDSTTDIALPWTPAVCEEDLGAHYNFSASCLAARGTIYAASKLAKYQILGEYWQDSERAIENSHIQETFAWSACWPVRDPSLIKPNEKQCGFFNYPGPREVPALMAKLLSNINSYLKIPSGDPYVFALKAQRAFVAIHPFEKGDGRVSRFVMDFITEKFALPPIVVLEMNKDISTPLSEYISGAVLETNRSLKHMEECLDFIDRAHANSDLAEACQEVQLW